MKQQRFPTSGPILPIEKPLLSSNRKGDEFPLIDVPSMGEQSSANPDQVHPMPEQPKDGVLNIIKTFNNYDLCPTTEEELQLHLQKYSNQKNRYYPYVKVDPMCLSKYLLYIHEKKGIPNSNTPNRYLRQAKKLIDTYGKSRVKAAMIHIYLNMPKIEHPFGFKLVEETILRLKKWDKENNLGSTQY